MNYRIVFLVSGFLACSSVYAQVDSATTALDYKVEVYKKENIPFKGEIPYAFVREADVTQEWNVWRWVVLTEKQNLALYYPTKTIGSRINLINLLLRGVDNGEITPYSPVDIYNEFKDVLSKEDLDQRLGAGPKTEKIFDEFGNSKDSTLIMGRQVDDVKLLLVKEKIYFDRRHSTLNRVVIGFCPVRVSVGEGGSVEMDRIMWIYMPEARPLLARHPIFNDFNDAQNISFDDFFMQNRYSGRIFRESNVYDNRDISDYLKGTEDALYESQRLQSEIFNWEQDLWEY